MKRNLPLRVLLLLACCSYTCITIAQTTTADTSNYAIAVQNAIMAYHQYLSPQTGLYNGSEYVEYTYTITEGIPFFETSHFNIGSVEYNSMLYQNVLILYDEVLGEVVIKDAYGRGKIILNTDKVTAFNLLNHHFVRLSPDSSGKSPIRSGFYDVLYQGNTGVYRRQVKKILETITISEGLSRVIGVQDDYFIRKGTVFYPVNSKRAVLDITKDKKKEVQQFIRKNRLNIRTGKEIALIKIAAYYDKLTNK
jgi:hypothetical protein